MLVLIFLFLASTAGTSVPGEFIRRVKKFAFSKKVVGTDENVHFALKEN